MIDRTAEYFLAVTLIDAHLWIVIMDTGTALLGARFPAGTRW